MAPLDNETRNDRAIGATLPTLGNGRRAATHNLLETDMNYSTFAADVLCHGAVFACRVADQCGVPGGTLAKWLSRLTIKPRLSSERVA